MLILSRPLSILISSTCITFPYSTWWSFKQWYASLWFTTFSKPNVVWLKAMTLSPRRVHWQQTMGSITQHQLQRVATGFGLQICLLSKFSSWLDTVDARNPANHAIWVDIPWFTKFYTSKRWLALGFLKHQQQSVIRWLFMILTMEWLAVNPLRRSRNRDSNLNTRHLEWS